MAGGALFFPRSYRGCYRVVPNVVVAMSRSPFRCSPSRLPKLFFSSVRGSLLRNFLFPFYEGHVRGSVYRRSRVVSVVGLP